MASTSDRGDRATDAHRLGSHRAGGGRRSREVSARRVAALAAAPGRPRAARIARGLGRTYGDAAQNGGGHGAAAAGRRRRRRSSTPRAGTVTVPAGVSLDELLRVRRAPRLLRAGHAGHALRHRRRGHRQRHPRQEPPRRRLVRHVTSSALRLLLADGSVVDARPRPTGPELFWATVGGMGLTGIVLDATLRLLPIETSRMSVDTDAHRRPRHADGGDGRRRPPLPLLASRGSTSWPRARHLGRSVLTSGDHATLDAARRRRTVGGDPLAYDPRQLVERAAGRPAARAAQPRSPSRRSTSSGSARRRARRVGQLQSIGFYFHPLDLVGRWNRLYGRAGLLQYQFVVPFGAEAALRTVIERLAASRARPASSPCSSASGRRTRRR